MIKGFRVQIVSRVLLLSFFIAAFIYLIIQEAFLISTLFLGALILFQLFGLVRYVETTNQKLVRFLDAINYNDYALNFLDKSQKDTFFELGTAFNKIMLKFKAERQKSEESQRYLETVVQHIGVGLISFNSKGEVELFNKAAKKLLEQTVLRNISQFQSIDSALYDAVKKLKSGERTLVRFEINLRRLNLAIYATEFRMKGENYKLISLQNITSELDEKEMEAWQNLTQVLAHEIMNSITPIASLSDTVNNMMKSETFSSLPTTTANETVEDVREALTTINNRSLGLMRFVNSYRNITQLPSPEFEIQSVETILNRVGNLMRGEATNQYVDIDIKVEPKSLEIAADAQMLDQALINIVKNAFKAVQQVEKPKIQLRSYAQLNGKVIIEIEDNGNGIKKSVLDKIFVPFYSTNKSSELGGGSGIGLSLSRQIMRMHGGILKVSSSEPGRTIFQMIF